MSRIRLPVLLQPEFDPRCEDPHAAPVAYKGDHPAPPFTLRRAAQNLAWVYASGLVFLLLAIFSLTDGQPSRGQLAVRIGLIAAIALGYLLATWVADLPLWTRWAYIAGFSGLLALRAFEVGWNFIGYGVYVCVLVATLIPWRQAWVTIGIVGALIAATFLVSASPLAIYISVIGVAVGWTTGGGIETGRIRHRLRAAETRVAVLAVAAERERIGRDLHDILGHSLTAIAIKSDLAARLVDRDPVAAKTQIDEITEIARQSLGDVRATASAIREVRVVTELASARSVLLAAGIEARVPSAVAPMTDADSELLGYVVREAVTNVVRHSQASTCMISVEPGRVSVADDGVGPPRLPGRGSGISGMTERVGAAGGTLVVEPRPGGGTVVRVQLTSADPVAAPVRPVTTAATPT